MNIKEIREHHDKVKKKSDTVLKNMGTLADESKRVSKVAERSSEILNDLDEKFEKCTGLDKKDVKFLFVATALQLTRIAIISELSKIEKAGSQNRNETKLHDFQSKLLNKLSDADDAIDKPYYASLNHIITKMGVPYDATTTMTRESVEKMFNKGSEFGTFIKSMFPEEKVGLFKGANHRFATLGHDPIIGLIFGTSNIMTNTITCVKKNKIGIPLLTTNHVVYTIDYKSPQIATYGSTAVMLEKTINRMKNQPSAFIAALIKQIIHIGTDMFTPCGIQIPSANLILSNAYAEKLTEYISWGDVVKIGTSAGIAGLINIIISALHSLIYDESVEFSRDVYSVRTKKIILYSNVIASSSNVIWTGANLYAGNKGAIKQLDIGGLLIMIKHLFNDSKYIRKVKEEFIFGQFNDLIRGNDLNIEKIY